uniref:Uncharacterized protein n=1 Tax=Romanomermis culicivorax TaxID=13658 RepID=A0A915HW04_ROMCU
MPDEASNKPYFPGWGADYVSCFEKVGKMEHRDYSKRILIILAFVDEPPSVPQEQVKKVVAELRDQEDVRIFVVATSKKSKSANQAIFANQMFFELGGELNTDYKKITSEIASNICDSVCSVRKSRADQCAWNDEKTLCIEKTKWEPLNKVHPACIKFKSVEKERPCPLRVCQDLCNNFQWGPWDECCGDTINETFAIRRHRNVSDYARHPDFCVEEEVALCIVNGACWKTIDLIIKRGETRFMAYIICLIFVIILAFIGATILGTSRKRSHRKLERRLHAAGVCMSLKDLAKDENLREAMKKMPLLASYVSTDENPDKESVSDDSSRSESNAIKNKSG